MPAEHIALTDLLSRAQQGDSEAWDQALPLVYDELKRIAAAHFRNEASGNLLQPTALVHEAWLKLARLSNIHFGNRTHFFSLSSRLMRQILVDQARRRRSGEALPNPACDSVDAAALDDALSELEKVHPRQCRVVEMRYFAGMTLDEIATELHVTSRTVKRDWVAARAFLFQLMQG
ncbi:MAG: ECF-type sigma factor [Bryobacteraceae bacterium]